MSELAIRGALQLRLSTMTPAIAIAWENDDYVPTLGTPFQAVNLLRAQTTNPTVAALGQNLTLHQGVFQVSLNYPGNAGPQPAEARAEAIKARFPRGLSLTSGSVTVRINRTPSVAPGFRNAAGWYIVPVSIPYFTHIYE